MKEVNVLSLFNGMNTGREALERVGVRVGKYYSSEIKKAAITLTQHHYADTIQLGNILNWKEWDINWSSIDLVLSGSPCKDLSVAGKRKGIHGKNSGLFWVFIDILNHIKKLNPDVLFFQENVGSAPKKDVGIMSRALGVQPCRMNSSLVTAQLRDRYYWSNIKTVRHGFFDDIKTDFSAPKNRKILFKDILTSGCTDREKAGTLLQSAAKTFGYKDDLKFTNLLKRHYDAGKQLPNYVYQINPSKESNGKQPYTQNRIYADYGKCPALTESKAAHLKVSYLKKAVFGDNEVDYLKKFEELVRVEELGLLKVKVNAARLYDYATPEDCIDLKFPTSTTRGGRVVRGKSPSIVESRNDLFTFNGLTIRPVNKIELCRLQGFPDDYCDILSRNQAAGLLGDGWTLPMIEHFFQFLPDAWKKEGYKAKAVA